MADSVTIDRDYFETLLRRSNHSLGATPFACDDETIVPVPQKDYEELLLLSRQFANLKRSLLGAGVTEENIATLVQDASSVTQADPNVVVTHTYDHNQSDGRGARSKLPTSAFQAASYTTHSSAANGTSGNMSCLNGEPTPYTLEGNHDWSSHEHLGGTFTPSYSADGPTDVHIDSFHQIHKPQPLLRSNVTEHIASVSFVREEDAVRFYEHARKNDIYIKNKRVFIKWADRHFILPGHVANKMAAGATRNLIIRRCGAHHTEDSVRDDLQHIHNLLVIKVEFIGGSCYIKTNSVHNAMFARTCMMSRAKYKGSKIEWDVDECDQPFEVVQKTSLRPQPPAKTPVAGTRNRFDMLRLDDDDNNESDDKFDTSSEMLSTVDVTA
ncbi:hypothetical protein EKO27_g1257 [Xylaria grammica]|uniref:Uncharacterized protein n=1 Tax=Xylaria grammica TaxID=363999 RepID=A0A439DHJ2_9PEZI|nr:hypothetical protein EKO27_g1257 [Xylaria grammica]